MQSRCPSPKPLNPYFHRWVATFAHPSVAYCPLSSEVERRNNYISVSLRVASRQKPTVLKLAMLFQLSSQELCVNVDQVMEAYNCQEAVAGTRLEISRTTMHASASASTNTLN